MKTMFYTRVIFFGLASFMLTILLWPEVQARQINIPSLRKFSLSFSRVCIPTYSTKNSIYRRKPNMLSCKGIKDGTPDHAYPIFGPLLAFTSGGNHHCTIERIKAIKTMRCHGKSAWQPALSVPEDLGEDVKEITAGVGFSCAIVGSRVRCFGRFEHNKIYQKPRSLVAANHFACWMDDNGTHCAGNTPINDALPATRTNRLKGPPNRLIAHPYGICYHNFSEIGCLGHGRTLSRKSFEWIQLASAGHNHTFVVSKGQLEIARDGSTSLAERQYFRAFKKRLGTQIIDIQSKNTTMCGLNPNGFIQCFFPVIQIENERIFKMVHVDLEPIDIAVGALNFKITDHHLIFKNLSRMVHGFDQRFLSSLDIYREQPGIDSIEYAEFFYFLALEPFFKHSGYSRLKTLFYPAFKGYINALGKSLKMHDFADIANQQSSRVYTKLSLKFLLASFRNLPTDLPLATKKSVAKSIAVLSTELSKISELNKIKLPFMANLVHKVLPGLKKTSGLLRLQPLTITRGMAQEQIYAYIDSL